MSPSPRFLPERGVRMAKYFMSRAAARRSDHLRAVLMIGLLTLTVTVLQVSFFGRIRILGVIPDLTTVTVVAIAFFCGKETGAVTGIAAGFLLEAMAGGTFVLLPLFYLLLCYPIGHYARAVIPKRFTVYLMMLAIALTARAALTLLRASLSFAEFSVLSLLWNVVLPELLLTAVCGIALFVPLRFFCRRLERRRII